MKLYAATKILLIAALVVAGAVGYIFYNKGFITTADPGAGALVMPTLSGQISAIDRIVLAGPDGSATLVKQGDAWVVLERGDFPANPAQVGDLLYGLETAAKFEPKTPDPAFYGRLGLDDRFVEVSVFSGEDKIGWLKTGDQFFSPTGEGVLTFALDTDTARAWTLSGLPEISPDPAFWLSKRLLFLSELRIKSLEVTIGDNPPWTISKAAPLAPGFTLAGPDGARADPQGVNGAALGATDLLFEDTRDADVSGLLTVATATYKTFDGLDILMTFYEKEGAILTTLAATHDPAVLNAPDTPAVLPDAPADGALEADQMNALWQGRVFLIPLQQLAAILKFRDEFFRTR